MLGANPDPSRGPMSLHLVPRVLQYFEQVAALGSIQAASRELGISASAIHRQITAVEDALGEPLFERGTRGMTLTPAGLLILELARDWRLDNARLWSVIQADRGVEQGEIRIAAMDGMVNGFVPELVRAVARRFPRLHLSVEITSPDLAMKGVLNGDIDIAAVVNVAPHDNLMFHWTRDFPLGCIAAPGHPLAARERVALVLRHLRRREHQRQAGDGVRALSGRARITPRSAAPGPAGSASPPRRPGHGSHCYRCTPRCSPRW